MLITGPEYSTDYCMTNGQCVLHQHRGGLQRRVLLPVATCRDMFVSYISDYDTYAALVECGFPPADKATEEALGNGDTVLLFYKMKP